MLGFHPFLYIAKCGLLVGLRELGFGVISTEIVREMLEKGYFFLELALLWVLSKRVLRDGVNFFVGLLLDVLEDLEVAVQNYFGGVVEVDTRRTIGKEVA
jgi:hypothetical protein